VVLFGESLNYYELAGIILAVAFARAVDAFRLMTVFGFAQARPN
jgi:hypothetical protein